MHDHLQFHFRYCCFLFCVLSLSKAAALQSLISTSTNLNLITPTTTNLSDLWPDLPNDKFEYSVHYQGADLPDAACIMTCVSALRELALLPDFSDQYPGKTWIMKRYPQAAMSVGKPGDLLTVRFAMWTIVAAIRDMLGRDNFQTSEFVGKYAGIKIAVVKFFAPKTIDMIAAANPTKSAMPQIAGAASTTIHSTANFSVNLGESNVNGSLNDGQLQAEVTYLTNDIPRRDVFMAIIWMLLNLAPHQNNERFRVLTITSRITTTVTTKFIRVAPVPPRVNPLMYGSLISCLAKLPEVLLRENRFCEMDIVVKENGITIGKGTVRSTAPSGTVGIPLTANVSVS